MARGKAHSEELKAEVAAALLAGMSVSETARRYSLDKSIVSRIRANLDPQKIQESCNKVATDDEIRIDVMIAEGLQSHLKMQRAITDYAAREEYIRTQNAADLSRLLEVSQNHSIRLLEAASAVEQDEDETE